MGSPVHDHRMNMGAFQTTEAMPAHPNCDTHIETEATYSLDATRRIRVADSQTMQVRGMHSLELN